MLNIQNPDQVYKISLLHLGFRPFFLGAGIFAIVSMVVWLGVFMFDWSLSFLNIAPNVWHGHEMVYGYSLAVIAGFLLTAVRNWTGINTLNGVGLLLLFLLWTACRILPFSHLENYLLFTAVAELLFISLLFISVLVPVLKVKQWKQAGVLMVLVLFFCTNALYWSSILQVTTVNYQVGLELGFYLVLLMIFIMARRVIPFFIEKGVDYPVTINNFLWLDIVSLLLLVLFALADVFLPLTLEVMLLASVLVLLHGIRLKQWYTKGIWQKPLLWVLYLAYMMLVAGFLLKAVSVALDIYPMLAFHTFAVGGVATITLGMMTRVSLGHTGRDVFDPPLAVILIFVLIILAALTRIILPLFAIDYYYFWIIISQILWICSFSVFTLMYAPMLIKPRIDGQYG